MFFAASAVSFAAAAHTIEGRVVSVSDGDTVTVLDGLRTQHRIRLAGIDAPKKAQPYGDASKPHLSELEFGKSVTVEYEKHDRYGRIVGKIMDDGHDASLEQLRAVSPGTTSNTNASNRTKTAALMPTLSMRYNRRMRDFGGIGTRFRRGPSGWSSAPNTDLGGDSSLG